MIRKLAPHLVHQIAAGEVIERPASVLKELMENALDAGASKINVSFSGGGMKLLKIEDDGCGIPEAELPLAFEAHATSKLEKFDDFEELNTFGFRGEAISSIAAMADLEIWSSVAAGRTGSRGRVAYGVVKDIGPADKRVGTEMTMRNLFALHPARAKFLKSDRGEAMQLLSVFKKYALSYPEKSFSLKDLETGRIHAVSPSSFLERVLWFLGDTEREHFIEIENENAEWKMKAAILRPRFHEKVRAGIHLFLQRRPFKDSKLEFAVKRAFEGFTLFPRDIAAVVFLEGSPKLYDVNVHPMKTEIRFVNAEAVFSFISRSIKSALEKEHIPEVSSRPSLADRLETLNTNSFANANLSQTAENPDSADAAKNSNFVGGSNKSTFAFSKASSAESSQSLREHFGTDVQSFQNAGAATVGFQENLFSKTAKFEFVASLDDTYLLCKREKDLYLFDQHALHERILYESLLKDFHLQKKIPSQRLLFPISVKFSGAETLAEQEDLLESLGFELRKWDGKSDSDQIQVVAAPAILKKNYLEVLSKVAEASESAKETMVRDILATMACHSAVRAHDKIDRLEIDRLLNTFQSEDALGHCPHGRPTFVRLQIRDLEKMFQRVV